MKRILVPCDFSGPAVNAYRLAVDIAQQSGGVVHLLHVIQLPVMENGIVVPVLTYEEQLFDDLEEKTQQEFQKITTKYNAVKVKVITAVRIGNIKDLLLEYVSENLIDLVVMGSRGASGIKEVLVGSNAERMVRHCPVPVLILKDYYRGPIRDIVFPNTLEINNQENLTAKVKELQAFFKARLHLVWINTPNNFTSDHITIKRLKAFASRYMLNDFTINVFNSTSVERGIFEFNKQVNGHLIAMGTHGRTGLSHIINGSLAEGVVNHSSGLIWTYSLRNKSTPSVREPLNSH